MDALTGTVPDSSIRIFLLIKNRLLREALFRHFRKRSDFLIVGQAGDADAAACRMLDTQCDVLVLDSLEIKWLTANINVEREGLTACGTILIGMEPDQEQFMAAVRAGVTGYLLKDASTSDVIDGVRAIFRGEAVCPPRLCLALHRFVAKMGTAMPVQISRPDLTLRQQRLVRLVAQGLTNKEIASHLNLSEFTVRNHINRILKQVDAGSRSEAVEAIRAYGYSISP